MISRKFGVDKMSKIVLSITFSVFPFLCVGCFTTGDSLPPLTSDIPFSDTDCSNKKILSRKKKNTFVPKKTHYKKTNTNQKYNDTYDCPPVSYPRYKNCRPCY